MPQPDGVTLHFNEYWRECHDNDLIAGGVRANGHGYETCHPHENP
jgi:hypothetical protein